VNSAKEFNDALEISGIVMTKLDGDARGGAALSVKEVTGKTIKFVGVSEKLDGLEPFHPDRMAQRILGMGDIVSLVEKAQEAFDQEQAQKQAEKLLRGRFTLDDMLQQFEQVQKLASGSGGFGGLLKMIPGASRMLDGVDLDESEFARMKAIIQSMTAAERERPDVIDNSRRLRIAKGSGTDQREVSGLLKQHREMKKMMSGRGKFGGMLGQMFGGGPGMPEGSMNLPPQMANQLRGNKKKGPSKKEIRKRRKKEKKKR
jgi:signal recognition particle subunit SRP54